MITAAFLTALTLTAGSQTDEVRPVPERAALQVEIEETHFMVRSLAEAPLLLVFASEDSNLQTALWLPAGGQYDEDFPRGTLVGLQLEVARPTSHGWLTSGALALDSKAPLGAQLMWVLDCGHAVTQEGEGESFSGITSEGSQLPAQLPTITVEEAHAELENIEPHDALHVPVLTPTDKPKGDKPPVLRKKPLPPV